MRKIWIVVALLLMGYAFFSGQQWPTLNEKQPSILEQSTVDSDAQIAKAFANHQNNVQLSGQGVVVKLLPDDDRGSRHQKFILKLSSGQTLLVAHNIDLAPRINSLREGDSVEFFGEYEWTERGGVIHWTHRDPKGSHVGGWLQHQGKRYQ